MTTKGRQRIVCVDTNILVWHIRKEGPPDLKQYAGYLFKQLENDKDDKGRSNAQVMVTTVVLTEFVTPVKSQEERDKLIAEISKRFLIEPFDARDAALAATLWHFGKTNRDKRNAPKDGQRAILRADTMIIATAKGHGATEFYSEDADARAMAQKVGLTARALPRMGSNLFEQSSA